MSRGEQTRSGWDPRVEDEIAALGGLRGRDVILASASPRRRDLLLAAGVAVTVRPSAVDEPPFTSDRPIALQAMEIARAKAAAVSSGLERVGEPAAAPVVGADTVVVVDEIVLGKPSDREDAERMLLALSGRTHEVLTAVAVAHPGGRLREGVEATRVSFRPLGADEIARYLDGGEPMDKAGAYAIQGGAGRFVTDVDGSYTNVVGLPLRRLLRLLEDPT
jgi:septum formation protein